MSVFGPLLPPVTLASNDAFGAKNEPALAGFRASRSVGFWRWR